MHYLISLFSLLGIVLAVPDGPVATSGVAPVNPYAAVQNPLAPGYNSYYNPSSATAPILTYSNTQDIDGSYSYSFSTGDGKEAQENGYLKDAYIDKIGEPQGTQVKEGSFSYVSPEGTPIKLDYVADENGFRHGGVHFSTTGNLAAPYFGNNGNQIYDPRLNYNNPFNYRNNYRNPAIGAYNPSRPFDPRYPYKQIHNPFNQLRPIAGNNSVKSQAVKESV